MKKYKTLGQVFTPDWIVIEILDLVGFKDENILNNKIIDPACGDGAFLKIIVKRIIEKGQDLNYSINEIKKQLEETVYGIEIDETEFKNCIDNLNNIILNKLDKTIDINWNIYKGDTLTKYKDYIGFFDFVVGNPPYIRVHNLDDETRKILKKEFNFSQGTIDIYLSFFELGFKLLNKKGILGYITPNSYLHNSSYINFRRFLKNKKAIKSLVDFKANKIFKNFSTYTAITIINFSKDHNSFDYKELIEKTITKVNEIKYSDLNDKDWSFSKKEDMEFLKNIYTNSNKKVLDFYNVQYGFATLRDRIFIGTIEKENSNLAFFNNHWIEKDILYKIVKGSTYKGNNSEIKYIIYPYKKYNDAFVTIPENELKKNIPKHTNIYYCKSQNY